MQKFQINAIICLFFLSSSSKNPYITSQEPSKQSKRKIKLKISKEFPQKAPSHFKYIKHYIWSCFHKREYYFSKQELHGKYVFPLKCCFSLLLPSRQISQIEIQSRSYLQKKLIFFLFAVLDCLNLRYVRKFPYFLGMNKWLDGEWIGCVADVWRFFFLECWSFSCNFYGFNGNFATIL